MTIVGLAVVVCGACGVLHGQQQADAKLAFEVVSVKASGSNRVVLTHGQSVAVSLRGLTYVGRRVTCNIDLRSILSEAYSVRDFQIVAPGWVSNNTYEVIALAPEGATKADMRRMLQTMLAERFGLRLHHETRQLPVYAMVVAKGGFKGRPAESATTFSSGSGSGSLTATAITFERLAAWLSRMGSVPVVDETGLAGSYQVDLHWPPDDAETGRGAALPGGLVMALNDQLGIRLEKRTTPWDLLVVDQIEKTPAGN